MSKKGYNPVLIANKIFEIKEQLHKEDNYADHSMTIMELLKLVYICHGYHLANFETPLLEEGTLIEAWQYGPVIVDLYKICKYQYETHKINESIKCNHDINQELDQNAIDLIQQVVEEYRSKNGWDLSILTHQPDSPWSQTIEKSGGFYGEIKNNKIKNYYKSLITK